MSRIEELTKEREKLRIEQLKHQKGIEECERRQLEISNQIRELKVENDRDANKRLCFEIDEARARLQKICDKVLGEGSALVGVSLTMKTSNVGFQRYDFD